MSPHVNMLDAKTSLSKLVQDIESGAVEEIIIARNGRPAARLVALASVHGDRGRRIGAARGLFDVPGNIDQDNDEVRRLFEARTDATAP